jgi:hypothetical protein
LAGALGRRAAPRVIDEHAPHEVSCGREEVGAVLPAHLALIGEPHEDLVHERRGWQRVVRTLTTEVVRGQRAQFLVQHLDDRLTCGDIAGAPRM